MQVPLAVDSDGFLRRECPGCLRQFKCFYGRHPDAPDRGHLSNGAKVANK